MPPHSEKAKDALAEGAPDALAGVASRGVSTETVADYVKRYREFLQIMAKIETVWIRTGDPQLREALSELYQWESDWEVSDGH